MKNIEVSFCIVVYNHEKYIEKAIESVCYQNFSGSRELIIGVDKSNDATLKVLEEALRKFSFGGDVTLIEHETNVGACENYRAVHNMARGDFIAHLDGDDYFSSELKTQKQLDIFEKYKNVSVVFTGREGEEYDKDRAVPAVLYKRYVSLLKRRPGGDLHSSKMYRRKSSFHIPATDFLDKEMHMIHSYEHDICYIAEPLTFYRLSTGVSKHRNLVRRLFRRALKNCAYMFNKREKNFLEFMIYAELLNDLRSSGNRSRLTMLLQTRLKSNYLVFLKLLKLKITGSK